MKKYFVTALCLFAWFGCPVYLLAGTLYTSDFRDGTLRSPLRVYATRGIDVKVEESRLRIDCGNGNNFAKGFVYLDGEAGDSWGASDDLNFFKHPLVLDIRGIAFSRTPAEHEAYDYYALLGVPFEGKSKNLTPRDAFTGAYVRLSLNEAGEYSLIVGERVIGGLAVGDIQRLTGRPDGLTLVLDRDRWLVTLSGSRFIDNGMPSLQGCFEQLNSKILAGEGVSFATGLINYCDMKEPYAVSLSGFEISTDIPSGLAACLKAPSGKKTREVQATASASVRASRPIDAIDGEATMWKAPSGEQWYQLDLGEMVPIDTIHVEWTVNCARQYVVEVSDDGEDFRVVAQEDDLEVDANRKWLRKPGEQMYALEKPIPARYVRLRLREASHPEIGYELTEVLINGSVPICFAPVENTGMLRDESIPLDERVDALLSMMTYREKLHLAGGYDKFNIDGLPRFGLSMVQMSDTTSGVKLREKCRVLDESTSFPTAIALGATWHPELAYEMGEAIAQECRANGSRILLAPGINIYRSSTCGRNFEYFGEDPLLTADMAVAYIQGVQSQEVIATVKHFIANNNEFLRHQSNAVIDDRALHEIYLPAFKAAIQQGQTRALMSSYNWFNGEKCGESETLLTDILRDELGYEWMVMSDWGGTKDLSKVPGSGQNIVMPEKKLLHSIMMKRYAQNPQAADAELTAMVRPTVKTLLDTKAWFATNEGEPEFLEIFPVHKTVARRVATEAVTLLKNDHILPLKKTDELLVMGEEAAVKDAQSGSGSGEVKGYDHVSYLDGLMKTFSHVTYKSDASDQEIKRAGTIIYFLDTGGGESEDRPFELDAALVTDIRRVAALNARVVVVASSGSAFSTDWVDDVEALVLAYYLGQERGSALAAILSGDANPSGKLPFSFEVRFEDSPAYGSNVIDGVEVWQGNDKRFKDDTYDVKYTEGVFVGYRWYEGRDKEVRFPFGYGLSYTSFRITGAEVSRQDVLGDGPLEIRVSVKNTGPVAGAEVVQCYVNDVVSNVPRPYRELKSFKKLFLNPGEEKTVVLSLEPEDFAYWDTDQRRWVIEPGAFNLLIGNSSRDVQQTISVKLDRDEPVAL